MGIAVCCGESRAGACGLSFFLEVSNDRGCRRTIQKKKGKGKE